MQQSIRPKSYVCTSVCMHSLHACIATTNNIFRLGRLAGDFEVGQAKAKRDCFVIPPFKKGQGGRGGAESIKHACCPPK